MCRQLGIYERDDELCLRASGCSTRQMRDCTLLAQRFLKFFLSDRLCVKKLQQWILVV